MAFKTFIVASTLVLASPASATFIAFNGLTGANGSAVTAYTESGYTFTATGGSLSTIAQYNEKELGTTSSATVALTYAGGTFALNVLGGLTGPGTGSGTISFTGFLGNTQVNSGSYVYSAATGASYVAIPSATVDRIVLNLDRGTATNIALSGFTVSQASVAIAPEPASWTLTITGFGLVGTALRRRKVAVAVG